MEQNPIVQTTVQTVDTDLSDIFNFGQTADSSGPSKGIFNREPETDVSFLDETEKPADDKNPNSDKANPGEDPKLKETLDQVLGIEEGDEDKQGLPEAPGKTRTEKNAVVNLFKKEIEAGRMFTFDDYDPAKADLDQYLGSLSQKDIEELWSANHETIQTKTREQVSQEFFESLPEQLQYAYEYAANGGTDMRSLFGVLAQAEETRQLDVENPDDQKAIARQYLQATQFGDAAEIEEEISTWEQLNVMDRKAKQFKPKLDKMNEDLVQLRIEEQKQIQIQNQKAAEQYMQNAYNALAPGDINGLKIDKKVQNFLFNAITKFEYPSLNGNPTNLMGHLLEKYQYQEPNYALIAEATWLLADPAGYKAQLARKEVNQEVTNTVRKLKTEEGRKQANVSNPREEEQTRRTTIPRPTNIFQRSR